MDDDLSERLRRAASIANSHDDSGMAARTLGLLRDFRDLFLEAAKTVEALSNAEES